MERDWARIRVGRDASARRGRANDKRAEINIAMAASLVSEAKNGEEFY